MRILLAIDGSKFSEAATQTLIAQAQVEDDEVLVLHVVDVLPPIFIEMRQYYPGVEQARDAQFEPAAALVAKTADWLRSQGLRVTTAVEVGIPKSGIIDAATQWHANLILLGSHGRTALDRFLVGSVSDAVLRHAPCSVELVRIARSVPASGRALESPGGKVTKILLAIDESKFSEAASQMLMEQVRPETEVQLLHVVEPMPLLAAREMGGYDPAVEGLWDAQTKQATALVNSIAAGLRLKRVSVATEFARGNPKSEILDAAEKWKADLIVLGSHGRTGLARFLLGSVSEAVARHAHCSVEIVRIDPGHS